MFGEDIVIFAVSEAHATDWTAFAVEQKVKITLFWYLKETIYRGMLTGLTFRAFSSEKPNIVDH